MTPQNLAACARRNPRCEGCGRGAIYCAIGAAGDFMESAQGKPSAWQLFIDCGDMEWKNRSQTGVKTLDAGDLVSEILEAGRTGGWHDIPYPFSRLFSFCSLE